MKPRYSVSRRDNYGLVFCGDDKLLVWAGLAGFAAGAVGWGSVVVYVYMSPSLLYGLFATLLASIVASLYAACAAYLGARWMLPEAIYALSFYYIPAAIAETILHHDPVSAASAAIDSLLLAAAGVYEEVLIRGRSGLAAYLLREARETLLLSTILVAGGVAAAYAGHPRIAALTAALAGYVVLQDVRRYFERSVWGWGGAPVWEKAAASGMLLFYASLAALFLLI